MELYSPKRLPAGIIIGIALLLIIAFILRIPIINRDLVGIFAWKSIRHHQFAISMLETKNPFVGYASYTQPELRTSESFTEAPLTDWCLVPVYALFGPSVYTLRVVMLAAHFASLLLGFLVLSALFGALWGFLGMMAFSLAPFVVYFSGHAFGESFIYAGEMFMLFASARLLAGPLSVGRVAALFGACVFLCLGKISTGFLIAAFSWLWVIPMVYRRNREILRGWFGHRKFLFWEVTAGALGIPVVGWMAFVYDTYSTHGLAHEYLLMPGYFGRHWFRWTNYFGKPLLPFLLLALGFFLIVWLRKGTKGQTLGLHPEEMGAMGLLGAAVFSMFWQAKAFYIHDYYSIPLIFPVVAVLTAFFKRLFTWKNRLPFAVMGTAYLGVFLWGLPGDVQRLWDLHNWRCVSESNQHTMRQFFRVRNLSPEKFFIIAHDPLLPYFGDTYMLLKWTWEEVREMLCDTPENRHYLENLRIEYIVYPLGMVDQSDLDQLQKTPLIDWGEGYLKLGLVHRGDGLGIFKITKGIVKREPVLEEEGFLHEMKGWTSLGRTQTWSVQEERGTRWLASEPAGAGCQISFPFFAKADALAFRMGGSASPDVKLELRQNGVMVYEASPESPKPAWFAFDALPLQFDSGYLIALDNSPQEYLQLSDFEFITYESIFPSAKAILSVREMFQRVTFGTFDWPGHPTWTYITLAEEHLEMAAHEPGEAEQTLLQFRLDPGKYKLWATGTLRGEAFFPVVLQGFVVGPGEKITSTGASEFKPGQQTRVLMSFEIGEKGGEFRIVVRMVDGATNNFNATLMFDRFIVECW